MISWASLMWFQSSPTPKGGCDAGTGHPDGPFDRVSILTHPEGRVRQGAAIAGRLTELVSILTHPEGRVRLWVEARMAPPCVFQSSPTPKGGCDLPGPAPTTPGLPRFNPHPPRRAGATGTPEVAGTRGHQGFNPHPPRRAGATPTWGQRPHPQSSGFNPHPPRRAGATGLRPLHEPSPQVSILTHPEGRVRHQSRKERMEMPVAFQSSPTPKGGCD